MLDPPEVFIGLETMECLLVGCLGTVSVNTAEDLQGPSSRVDDLGASSVRNDSRFEFRRQVER